MLADFLAYTEYMERTLAAPGEPLSQDELAALLLHLGTPAAQGPDVSGDARPGGAKGASAASGRS